MPRTTASFSSAACRFTYPRRSESSRTFSRITLRGARRRKRSNGRTSVPRILRRFWLTLVISSLLFAMIVVFSTDLLPLAWKIPLADWAVIFPLAVVAGSHILFPIVLNLWLMIFSYRSPFFPLHGSPTKTGPLSFH